METTIIEADFGLDEFQDPKTLQGDHALARTILMILFGKEGFYPSMPQIGMNIKQYFYDYDEDIDVTMIKTKLTTQCSLISDMISEGNVDVQKVDNNGSPLLLFTIPTVNTDSKEVLVIGVTTSENNSISYNYAIMNSDFNDETI